jgi:putative SOS response-associated peptidase YedK
MMKEKGMQRNTMEDLARHFKVDDYDRDVDLRPEADYNIAPGKRILVIVREGSRRILARYRWGMVPSWAKDPSVGRRMINARAETLHEKPFFRQALAERRCLVAATGYYEWKTIGSEKVPVYIHIPSSSCIAFAGLHERWVSRDGKELRTCLIITTESCPSLSEVHPRMPLILSPEDYGSWLDRTSSSEEVKVMLRPYRGEIACYRVGKHVNYYENNSAQCILPEG